MNSGVLLPSLLLPALVVFEGGYQPVQGLGGLFYGTNPGRFLAVETVVRGLMEQLLVSIIAGLPTQWASAPPIRNV